jgi:putative ABC transport system permease protein
MALGATHQNVRVGVVLSAGRLALTGMVIGLLGGFVTSRLIAALLYETSPLDPLTFAGVACALIVVALIAGYIPAWRASHIDPIEALRGE